ncbi:MAG: hypothetical protein IJG38_16290 [Thermoguttaceae bacterium]|nr:hypothetical protein [Thermoguttaceae bacterium]
MPERYFLPDISVSLQYKDGSETIIYHEASGSIHLINELGVNILNALSERPLTIDELVDTIHAREINIFESVRQFLKIGVEEGLIEEIPDSETK